MAKKSKTSYESISDNGTADQALLEPVAESGAAADSRLSTSPGSQSPTDSQPTSSPDRPADRPHADETGRGNSGTPARVADQSDSVNILEQFDEMSGPVLPSLGLVRLGLDETAIIPFTADGKKVSVHYCREVEIQGYVLCGGDGCVLCCAGRKRDERLLVPVYLPALDAVAVLPVSPSLRPHALMPQLVNVLRAGKPMIMFIKRNGDRYTVATSELEQDADGRETVIQAFVDDYTAKRIDLSTVYMRIDNEQLAQVPDIARMLALKGGVRSCR
jgi:hypothetical protein